MREIWEGSEKVFWLRRSTLYVLRCFWEGFPFEKDLRRYSDWEGAPCMCWDGFEKVIWWVMREIWEGSEKVFWLRRSTLHVLRWFWEGFVFEKVLRSMELLQSSWDGFEIWDGSQKEIYPPHNSGHTNIAPSDEINKDAVWRNDAVLKLSLIKLYSFHMTDYNFEHNSL